MCIRDRYKSLNQSYYGLSRVRPALLYYLLVKQCLSTEEKEELYVAALSSGLDHMYIRKKIEPPLFAYVSRFTAKLIVHYLSDVEW